jgi:hypothetical protein
MQSTHRQRAGGQRTSRRVTRAMNIAANRRAIERSLESHRRYLRCVYNTGIHSAPAPYAGPKQFEIYHPAVQERLDGGHLRGRPPTPFVVRRDEHLVAPFGGFRVYWRDVEVGRTLSFPTFEDCRRLRETRRYTAPREEQLLAN